MSHLGYARIVLRHKLFVLMAGLRLGGIPLWRLLVHDWRKFTPAEWNAYRRKFGTPYDKNADECDFHRAWVHHWHHSPHHWEHWLRLGSDNIVKPMKMPEHFAREMVADWMGAGRACTGSWEVNEWYSTRAGRILLHRHTRLLAEQLIIDSIRKGDS